ncbi:UNKNOWN [Stylonychia lemnae]|uniref:Uncharacterized protein n=1 Tax=Stylonychia lemnae TaxID=5949 RepID=A0A077ZS24_STYLE|nr:UNKNOWN [Stylonychia lemnae]|eukprot:CDW72289.1 UNKNOWN [Stylonychia lemnae]
MESAKKDTFIKFALAALGISVSAYVIYKLTHKEPATAEQSPLQNIVDQRASQLTKVQNINACVNEYIQNQLLKGEPLKTTEDLLLKKEDFHSIQMAMELYAKVLLYESRVKGQEERIQFLERNDMVSYTEKVYDQLHPEIHSFMEAQDHILTLAKVDRAIYNASQKVYTNGLEGIHDAIILALSSPFKAQRGFGKQETINMLIQITNKALQKVQEKEVLECILEKDEIIFIYDALVGDYAQLDYQVHAEEFKALISKHQLLKDSQVIAQIDKFVQKLHELNEKYE